MKKFMTILSVLSILYAFPTTAAGEKHPCNGKTLWIENMNINDQVLLSRLADSFRLMGLEVPPVRSIWPALYERAIFLPNSQIRIPRVEKEDDVLCAHAIKSYIALYYQVNFETIAPEIQIRPKPNSSYNKFSSSGRNLGRHEYPDYPNVIELYWADPKYK